ncbi:MAG: arsenate reductase ArsC [Longimicrobiales bacterium]
MTPLPPPAITVRASRHPAARDAARRLTALAGTLAPDRGIDLVEADAPGPVLDVAGHPVRLETGELHDWVLEAALLRALEPAHVLFLCVANSARSQMAEGIARSLAPDGVRVSSAGSEPSRVRPQAVEVLREIGIDASEQFSKGVDDVGGPVDAVVTLCAEEACPVWLETAWRVHWALPDPAGAGADAATELEAFRRVRDELRRRLGLLFGR